MFLNNLFTKLLSKYKRNIEIIYKIFIEKNLN